METLHSMEIIVTLFVQSLGTWLASPLKLISILGQEEFYLLLVPLLYWSVDSAIGMRVGLMLLITQMINHSAKIGFHSPRPYWIDPRVIAYAPETSFGIPSNHAEGAAAIWGLLAALYRRSWVTAAAIILIFSIGFSRIFLGVHFLSDVLTGWLLGGLTLLVFVKVEPAVTAWVKRLSMSQLYGLAAVTTLGMMGLTLLVFASVPANIVQDVWIKNSLAAFPDISINPLKLDGIFTISGTWFGLLCGAIWFSKKCGTFDSGGSGGQRLLRYAIGAVGVMLIWSGLGSIFPRNADLVSYLLRFVRYILLGLWISAFAPLLFIRVGVSRLLALPEGKRSSRPYPKPETNVPA